MKILVTGGAGYIGSHTCVELLEAGHQVLVLDNLSNSKLDNLEKVSQVVNIKLDINETKACDFSFIKGDVRDKKLLIRIFSSYTIDGVIHFAGLKAVGESVEKPIKYYNNNVVGSVVLIEVMKKFDCKTFVFSSSATVYGEPHTVPIKENFPLSASNPYGQSKLIVENFLRFPNQLHFFFAKTVFLKFINLWYYIKSKKLLPIPINPIQICFNLLI